MVPCRREEVDDAHQELRRGMAAECDWKNLRPTHTLGACLGVCLSRHCLFGWFEGETAR